MQIIFLDIDGVLNGHDYDPEAQSCTIRRECINHLSTILAQSEAKIVISSAWRYMITRGAMTLRGFEYMLRTHGLRGITNRIIGTTREDEDQTIAEERGLQILEWLSAYPEVIHYVVIDDMDLGIDKLHKAFVRTDGKVGLTTKNVEEILRILNAVL